MTTNGTETLDQKRYKTNDGCTFNYYTNALEYLISESQKTSTVTAIMEFQEYYY